MFQCLYFDSCFHISRVVENISLVSKMLFSRWIVVATRYRLNCLFSSWPMQPLYNCCLLLYNGNWLPVTQIANRMTYLVNVLILSWSSRDCCMYYIIHCMKEFCVIILFWHAFSDLRSLRGNFPNGQRRFTWNSSDLRIVVAARKWFLSYIGINSTPVLNSSWISTTGQRIFTWNRNWDGGLTVSLLYLNQFHHNLSTWD